MIRQKFLAVEEIKSRTHDLLELYAVSPDHKRRLIEAEIFELNKSLVYKTMKMFSIPSQKYDDFFQEASRGMIEAIRRFNLDSKCRFSTFAVTTMKGVIMNGYRDYEWTLNVPRTEKERGVKISKIAHDPERLGLLQEGDEEIERILALVNAQHPAELTDEFLSNIPQGIAHDSEYSTEGQDLMEQVDKVLGICSPEETAILEIHFLEGYTAEEIAIALIKSPEEVERMISAIIERCRKTLSEESTSESDGTRNQNGH